jgi:hypothetical protein
MTRLRFLVALALAAALVPLAGFQVAGAYGIPYTEPAPTAITTIAAQPDGELLVVGADTAGRWEVVARNVTITRELDGSTGIGWPCLPPSGQVDIGSALGPVTLGSYRQAGKGWDFEFTAADSGHWVVPAGPCGARVVTKVVGL